jgi:ribosome-interacting GTPase 1
LSSNIGAEAKAAYGRYLEAGSLELKIQCLQEFISLIPKHKGTEKIVALNKSRLAKLKREVEDKRQQQKTTQKVVSPFSIKKEGIQIILISSFFTPGAGKTSVLNYLTGAAKDKIGKYTSLPEIGIYLYNSIRFQIVEMPSIMQGASEGVGNGKEILSQIRSCDLLCLCVDLSRNIEEQMGLLLDELSKADIKINRPPPPLNIQKTGSNKIQVFYLTTEAKDVEDLGEFTERIKDIVHENGIRNAIIKISGEITLDDVIDALTPSVVYKKAIIIATKGDLPYTEEKFENLEQDYSDRFPLIIGTSVKKGTFRKDFFGEQILKNLKKIRIYTMDSAGKVAEKPLVMNENSKIKDAALEIHKSFYESFDHAIVIREGSRQKRKKVGLDYVLIDKDIIEIYTT